MTKLRRSDIVDTEITDAVELASDGTSVFTFKLGVDVVSVVGATKTVTISGWNLFDPDNPVEAGDWVFLTGNVAAGKYTVSSVVDSLTFTVVEVIPDATGGFSEFRYPPGAKKVGFDGSGVGVPAVDVQEAIEYVQQHGFPDLILAVDGSIVYIDDGVYVTRT